MQSQKSVVIDNFSQMLPEVPQGSEKNKNFLIANANPQYWKGLGLTIQEEQIAPLYASTKKESLNYLTLSGSVCHLFKNNNIRYTGEFYVLTDNGYLYRILKTGTAYGSYPALGYGETTLRGIIYANSIILSSTTSGFVKYGTYPISSWTTISTTNSLNVAYGIRQMETFQGILVISDGNASITYPRFLRTMDTSFTISSSDSVALDLGVGVACRGLKNFNDKYLAIAVGNAFSPTSYIENYIRLWDVKNLLSPTFQYSVKIPGLYLGMEVIKGVLYVLVEEKSGQLALYYLSGTILKKVFDINYASASTVSSASEYNILDYFGMIGINLSIGLLVYDRDDGVKFLLNKDAVTMYVTGQSGEELYSGVGTTLYKETGTTFNNLDYKSQYFEISGVLNNIEVFYDYPPTGTDKISVYIDAVDENSASGYIGNLITQLTDIDSTTALNSKRTLLDGKGITFSKIRLRLTTTGNWNCIIRKIKLNISPITGQ